MCVCASYFCTGRRTVSALLCATGYGREVFPAVECGACLCKHFEAHTYMGRRDIQVVGLADFSAQALKLLGGIIAIRHVTSVPTSGHAVLAFELRRSGGTWCLERSLLLYRQRVRPCDQGTHMP